MYPPRVTAETNPFRGGPGHKLLVGLIFFVIIEEKFISII
jgi:hypothetical protein